MIESRLSVIRVKISNKLFNRIENIEAQSSSMAGRLGSRASIVLSAMAAVDSVLPYATVLFA